MYCSKSLYSMVATMSYAGLLAIPSTSPLREPLNFYLYFLNSAKSYVWESLIVIYDQLSLDDVWGKLDIYKCSNVQ